MMPSLRWSDIVDRLSPRIDAWGGILFWSWNLLFVLFVGFGLLPTCLVPLLRETLKGFVPWDFAFFILVLPAIPVISCAVGFHFRSRGSRFLLRWFYGVQAPLLVLCLLRLFAVRELSPGLLHVVLITAVGLLGYSFEIFQRRVPRSPVAAIVQLIVQSLGLVISIYCGAVLLFFALPLGCALAAALLSPKLWSDVIQFIVASDGSGFFMLMIGGALAFYSATLFVALPVAVVALYSCSWARVRRTCANRWTNGPTWGVTFGVGVVSVCLFVIGNRQPQQAVFGLLDKAPATDAERIALVGKSEAIRAGLLNAYLAPYRYLSANGEGEAVADLYEYSFGMSEAAARWVQEAFNRVAAPLVYDGQGLDVDHARASDLYEAFFDQPIQRAEREAVQHALTATYDSDGAAAGLLNIGQRQVWLSRQEVTASEAGDWAEIEVHEVYESQSLEALEVLYYFNLPATAVVTGLWLGESDDRSRRQSFLVAPRGAAQAVYRREVNGRRDPSLLEQVGPQQYRLRAFPIPPRPDRQHDAPPLHLWFSYKVLIQPQGWPLPVLSEQRNVYWDGATTRLLRGHSSSSCGDRWLCAFLPAETAGAPRSHSVALSEGTTVRAIPSSSEPKRLPDGGAFAVVLDRSASMGNHSRAVAEAFEWLQRQLAPSNQLDLYLTSAESRGEPPSWCTGIDGFDVSHVVYFGGQNTVNLLRQYDALRGERRYDATFVLTDRGGFDLAHDKEAPLSLTAPLWMVHLGGKLPVGYDDALLDAIDRPGGGVAVSIADAVHGLAQAGATERLADGYRWIIDSAEPDAAIAPEVGFAALAARQLIQNHRRNVVGDAPADLEPMHALAKRVGIVSPYSSMIVLVSDAQRDALGVEEKRSDRFERETETGKEALGRTAVAAPEPEQWLLLCIVGLMLLWTISQAQQKQRDGHDQGAGIDGERCTRH